LVKRGEREEKSKYEEAQQIYVFFYLACGLQGFVVPFMISDLSDIFLSNAASIFIVLSGNVFLQDVEQKFVIMIVIRL
jgi:hypothetical protein